MVEEQRVDRVCPACRITRLSRYNHDPLCGPCLAAAREATGAAPVWIWDSAPLRQALARADMAAVLAILRGATGMSQLDFGALLGWSQSVVTKVERRKRDTFHDIREILRIADLLGMPRQVLLPLIIGRADAKLESDQQPAFWGDVVAMNATPDRRHFMMTSSLAMSTMLMHMALPPKRIDQGHVRYLRASLERLRRADGAIGGAALLPHATALFARARAMLDEYDYAEHTGRDLLAVTADLGEVGGWLAYDSGDQHLARSLYAEAALLAASVGDNSLLVHIYLDMAQQATHLARITGRRGSAREALRLADRAAQVARHIPSPALHTLIWLRQALAYAQLGDAAAFHAAIGRARNEADRGPHDSDQNWTAFVTHSEIAGYEAMGSLRLCSPDTAARLYQAVLTDSSRSPRDLAYYQARLAAALATAGDSHSALTQGMTILGELGGKLTSVRVLNELRPLLHTPGAQSEEFRQRFDVAARKLTPAAA
ncbi:helix-turn-helix transcriptional regulator [Sphaerisporangium sp. NPDC051011]|uniref:helix-turn-helix domain-containing protein n=1 Tax=Sphaerisporangium sp. NPDC051011 TaxID=3155792 RepID=UPI003407B739